MWLARQSDGRLLMFKQRPRKSEGLQRWIPLAGKPPRYEELNSEWFPEVKWKDKEPTEIILKKEKDNGKEI